MKLPIYLNIESDTIWTEYKAERDKIKNANELKAFIKKWENLFTNIQEVVLTEEVLANVKIENIDSSISRIRELAYSKWEKAGRPHGIDFWLLAEKEVNEDCDLIAELIVPVKVVKAIMVAKEYAVPLNCAFIQMNGGLGEFEG